MAGIGWASWRVRLVRMLLAPGCGRKPIDSIAAWTRTRVSSPRRPRPLNRLDTVWRDTPAGRISVFNRLTDGIVSNTSHPNEAWELVQWLASPQSQRIVGSGGYVWPAIRSLDLLFLSYWTKKGIDVRPFLTEATGKTVNFPVATGLAEALSNIETQLGQTFLGSASAVSGLAASRKILDYRIAYFK